jgi:hypothetical protein
MGIDMMLAHMALHTVMVQQHAYTLDMIIARCVVYRPPA